MTVNKWRLTAVERLLGLDGARTVCPQCDGSGRMHDADSPWIGWKLRSAMVEVAQRMGTEPDDAGPEPDEPLTTCGLCSGSGVVGQAVATEWRRGCEADAEQFHREVARVAQRMTAIDAVSGADAAPMPVLRAVD